MSGSNIYGLRVLRPRGAEGIKAARFQLGLVHCLVKRNEDAFKFFVAAPETRSRAEPAPRPGPEHLWHLPCPLPVNPAFPCLPNDIYAGLC